MTRAGQERPARVATLWKVCLVCLAAVLPSTAAISQAPGGAKTVEGPHYRFSVAIPSQCRSQEGPGTLDAVCPDDPGAEKNAVSNALNAFVLQISAQPAAGNADQPGAGAAQGYTEAAFTAELPEAVCGDADAARVKIENVKSASEGRWTVYTADVLCPAVRFLRVPARKAAVRYLIGPAVRYRLSARAPSEDFERHKAAVDAFFASFDAGES